MGDAVGVVRERSNISAGRLRGGIKPAAATTCPVAVGLRASPSDALSAAMPCCGRLLRRRGRRGRRRNLAAEGTSWWEVLVVLCRGVAFPLALDALTPVWMSDIILSEHHRKPRRGARLCGGALQSSRLDCDVWSVS